MNEIDGVIPFRHHPNSAVGANGTIDQAASFSGKRKLAFLLFR
jgi:hypothetical protein